ncbi:MarR family winged helix-turn-helix transcriptional regulator [Marinobacterium rhizophilum]|uniref:MarR family winged helix-turn-helix transcriptional regulator n=1 Tax=Marinobacterium rhizophilum TaxID=420402 RepID=UPI00037780AF|nr:MarR family transcriptional regulator [Marinobacterium rhizophilum]
MSKSQSALVLIRQIIRATDLHDKQLSRVSGLTLPQLLTMQTLQEGGSMTIGLLAREMNLAQATVTSILDRLEKKQLVERRRDSHDKRKVWACLSETGIHLLETSPTSLQDLFIGKFEAMEEWEQSMVITSLERVAGIINALDIDAAPVFDIGDLARSSIDTDKHE